MDNQKNDDVYCGKFTGIAQVVKESADILLFIFDKNSMSADTRAYYFDGSHFKLSSNCILDQDFCTYLQVEEALLKEGTYPLADTGATYEVRLVIYRASENQLI